ncbi:MAG TPA: hypothetical protein VFT77_04245, partial [Reyranella sp.]|nr:hypothetical protein [Reyranella sp.]
MAAISSRRAGAADYTWPGYVDALTTLLMVLIFLISVFSVAQFTLSNAVTNRDTAIDALNRQVSTLADQLSFQKKSAEDLQKDVAALTLQIGKLKTERDQLSTSNVALQQAAKVAEDKSLDLQKESERQKLEMTRLAAALAAANDENGKLFSDLNDQEKLSAEQKANIVRLAAELASVKDELTKLSAQLDAADVKAK